MHVTAIIFHSSALVPSTFPWFCFHRTFWIINHHPTTPFPACLQRAAYCISPTSYWLTAHFPASIHKRPATPSPPNYFLATKFLLQTFVGLLFWCWWPIIEHRFLGPPSVFLRHPTHRCTWFSATVYCFPNYFPLLRCALCSPPFSS